MGMDLWTGWVLFQICPLLYLHIFSAAQGFSGYLSAALNSDKEPGQSYVILCLFLSLYQVTHLETNSASTFLKLYIIYWLN